MSTANKDASVAELLVECSNVTQALQETQVQVAQAVGTVRKQIIEHEEDPDAHGFRTENSPLHTVIVETVSGAVTAELGKHRTDPAAHGIDDPNSHLRHIIAQVSRDEGKSSASEVLAADLQKHNADPAAHGLDDPNSPLRTVMVEVASETASDIIAKDITNADSGLNSAIADAIEKALGNLPGDEGTVFLPSLEGPATAPIGFNAEYTLKATASSGAVAKKFNVMYGGISRMVDAANGQATVEIAIPAGTPNGKSMTISVIATDGNPGTTSHVATHDVMAILATVEAPVVTSPLPGTNVSPASISIATSAFAVTGVIDTHAASFFKITSDKAGENILWQSGRSTTNKTSIIATLPQPVAPGTQLYVFGKHEGAKLGESPWSEGVSCGLAKIVTPRLVAPAEQAKVNPANLPLTSTAFACDSGVTDTHAASFFRLSLDSAGTQVLWESGRTTAEKIICTAAVTDKLAAGTVVHGSVKHEGQVLGESDWSQLVPFVVAGVLAPTITSPAANAGVAPKNITLTTSPLACEGGAVDTHAASFYKISTDSAGVDVIWESGRDTTNKTTITAVLDQALAVGAKIYAFAKHETENLGESAWSTALPMVVAGVQTPTLTEPAQGEKVSPASIKLTLSAFNPSGVADTHAASFFKIASDAAGENILWGSGRTTTNKTTITATLPDPVPSTITLYAFGKHEGTKLGEGPWSPCVPLGIAKVLPPQITAPIADSKINPTQITISTSAIACEGKATDTHAASEFKITTDEAGTVILWQSGRDTTHKTTITASITDKLAAGSRLYVFGRHEGAVLGMGDWSIGVPLRLSSLKTPTLTAPVANAKVNPSAVRLVSSAMSCDAGVSDVHAASYFRLSLDTAGTQVVWESGRDETHKTEITAAVTDKLAAGTVVYGSVKHDGQALGESDWSQPVPFIVAEVLAPTITSPAANAGVAPKNITLTTSPLACEGGAVDTHAASFYKISTDSAGVDMIWESGRDTTNKTTITAVLDQTLAVGAKIYAFAKHETENLGESAWSAALPMVVAGVQIPTITAPTAGKKINPKALNITMSGFTAAGTSDTHAASFFKVCSDIAGNVALWESGRSTTNKTSITASIPTEQAPGTVLYVFGKQEGAKLGETPWSAPVTVTVAEVLAPTILFPTAGAQANIKKLTVTTSAFACDSGVIDTHAASRFKITTDAEGLSVLWDSDWDTVNKTSTTAIVTEPVEDGATLHVFAKHKGTGLGESAWSAGIQINYAAPATGHLLGISGGDGIIRSIDSFQDGRFAFVGTLNSAPLLGIAKVDNDGIRVLKVVSIQSSLSISLCSVCALQNGKIAVGGTASLKALVLITSVSEDSINIDGTLTGNYLNSGLANNVIENTDGRLIVSIVGTSAKETVGPCKGHTYCATYVSLVSYSGSIMSFDKTWMLAGHMTVKNNVADIFSCNPYDSMMVLSSDGKLILPLFCTGGVPGYFQRYSWLCVGFPDAENMFTFKYIKISEIIRKACVDDECNILFASYTEGSNQSANLHMYKVSTENNDLTVLYMKQLTDPEKMGFTVDSMVHLSGDKYGVLCSLYCIEIDFKSFEIGKAIRFVFSQSACTFKCANFINGKIVLTYCDRTKNYILALSSLNYTGDFTQPAGGKVEEFLHQLEITDMSGTYPTATDLVAKDFTVTGAGAAGASLIIKDAPLVITDYEI